MYGWDFWSQTVNMLKGCNWSSREELKSKMGLHIESHCSIYKIKIVFNNSISYQKADQNLHHTINKCIA